MDKGKALEYGRPVELLENDAGAFTGRRVAILPGVHTEGGTRLHRPASGA
jgi:hypothetical protein